jgi:hypothetical protein
MKGEIMNSINSNMILEIAMEHHAEALREAGQYRLWLKTKEGKRGRNPGIVVRLKAMISLISETFGIIANRSADTNPQSV